MTSGKPEVTVVLPTFNERESLPRVVQDIHAALQGIAHEVLVADDNSPDGTWRWVEEAARQDPSLRLLRRMTNPGLSAAVLDGFRAARADKWIVMDADGQHDPALLPELCRRLDRWDLAVGTRYAHRGSTGQWNPIRSFGSRFATWLARLMLHAELSDPMSGYFGIRRYAFERVGARMNPRGFKVLLELYYRLGRYAGGQPVSCEVPYAFRSRTAGQSKLSHRIIRQYLQMLIALRLEERH